MTDKNLPKSTKQTLVAFEELIRKDTVVDGVLKFREIMGIPTQGLEFTEEDERELTDPLYGTMNCAFWVPERLKVSVGYLSYPETVENPEKAAIGHYRMTIVHTSRALIGGQGYTSERMCALMRLYVIFNKVIDIPLDMLDYEDDLLRIEHLPSELTWYDKDDVFVLNCMYDHFEEVSKKYPVAIYINPEATLNQVKDFISKKWNIIQSHTDTSKSLYAGKRTKRRQDLNDFIYENRELSLAQIRTKLAEEKNEFLDDGHIGKILSFEKKRRS